MGKKGNVEDVLEEDWEEEDFDSGFMRGIQPSYCLLKILKRPNLVAPILSTEFKKFGPVEIILRAIDYGNFPGTPRPHMISDRKEFIKAEPVKIDPLRHASRVQLSRDYAGLPAKTCGTIIRRCLHLGEITYTVESDLQDAAGNYRTFEIPERDVDYLASRNVSPRSV